MRWIEDDDRKPGGCRRERIGPREAERDGVGKRVGRHERCPVEDDGLSRLGLSDWDERHYAREANREDAD